MTLLPALAGAFGDVRDALTVDGESTSWSELQARAAVVAERIAGAPAVAVRATASLDTVVAVVGGLAAGVPVVPVPPDVGPVERDHIVRDSRAAVILGEAAWDDVALPVVGLDIRD